MEKRTRLYWSKLFAEQLKKGNDYVKLKKTITINILDFSYLPTADYHNVYHLREDKSGHLLTDILEIHFIELPKFAKEIENIEETLNRWLMFLGDPNERVLNMLEEKDAVIGKAAKVLHFLSGDPNTVRLAELREKAIWDEVSNINGARAEGKQIGMQKGLEQGLQKGKQEEKFDVALKMLEEGLPIETVVKITGLPLEEVSNLRH